MRRAASFPDTSPEVGIGQRQLSPLVQWGERLFFVFLFLNFLVPLLPYARVHPQTTLLLITSEALAVIFVLSNRAGALATAPYPVTVAFLGTAATLLVRGGGPAFVSAGVATAIMCCGLLLNISSKLTLRRSFGLIAANRGVRIGGPYRLVRHPMYLGYMVSQVGFLLINFSARNLSVYAIGWTAQLLRIREEEKLLMRDPKYQAFAAKTRYRLIPGLF